MLEQNPYEDYMRSVLGYIIQMIITYLIET